MFVATSGFRCLCYEGYEADDVMASLSSWSRDRGLNVVHISNDKGQSLISLALVLVNNL